MKAFAVDHQVAALQTISQALKDFGIQATGFPCAVLAKRAIQQGARPDVVFITIDDEKPENETFVSVVSRALPGAKIIKMTRDASRFECLYISPVRRDFYAAVVARVYSLTMTGSR